MGRDDRHSGPLRATSALSLVVRSIETITLLERLTDQFIDADKSVRIEIANAIGQVGGPASVLLLRLKAQCGDAEAEVTGQCFLSLFELAPDDALPFVTRFLFKQTDDVRFEAVSALAQAPSPNAIAEIKRFWSGDVPFELRRATVGALAASPHREAAEFL